MRRVLSLVVVAAAIGYGLTLAPAGAGPQACSVEGTGDFSATTPGSGSIGLSDYKVILESEDARVVATCHGDVLDSAACGRLLGRSATTRFISDGSREDPIPATYALAFESTAGAQAYLSCDPDDVDDDGDGDGYDDWFDNCQSAFNPRQDDADEDKVGDVCDHHLAGRIAGGGSIGIYRGWGGEQAHVAIQLDCAKGGDALSVAWGEKTFTIAEVDDEFCGDNPGVTAARRSMANTYAGDGWGFLENGERAWAEWVVTDRVAESHDTLRIVVHDGYWFWQLFASGRLETGDFRVKKI